MAWNATISKKINPDGVKVVEISFTDGLRTITDRFDIQGTMDASTMAKIVRDRIAYLVQQEASDAAIPSGVIAPALPDVPSIPVPPTQAELDQQQFLVDYKIWMAVKRGIDAGIVDATDPAVVALRAKVKAEFKPAYLPLF